MTPLASKILSAYWPDKVPPINLYNINQFYMLIFASRQVTEAVGVAFAPKEQ